MSLAGTGAWLGVHGAAGEASLLFPRFPNSEPRWSRTWDAAAAVVAGNIKHVSGYDQPVLLEGAVYPGVWQECGPHEGLVYYGLRQRLSTPEQQAGAQNAVRANHMVFFTL